MKIVSIEPTPSPHSMKINLDQSLPKGVSRSYTHENAADAPEYIHQLLAIDGVKSIFQVLDFITIDRYPKSDWPLILEQVRHVFGDGESLSADLPLGNTRETFGEIHVSVQTFRGLPIQIKLIAGEEEVRFPLPDRFTEAIMRAQTASTNLVTERKWEEIGIRYGDVNEIGEQVVQEIDAIYPDERLERLVARALEQRQDEPEASEGLSLSEIDQRLEDPDWKKRYAALTLLQPVPDAFPVLLKALKDSKTSVRRLATALLSEFDKQDALPYLFRALKDPSATIRRTAGDALSDIGDPAATEAMAEALSDSNKVVRWRAARFLYEVGDERALPALRTAQDDPEFEVSLQVKMAIERIEGGEEAGGTVWQRMTQSIRERKNK